MSDGWLNRMARSIEDLILEIRDLQDLLISFSTGNGGDDEQYQALRQSLLNEPRIKAKLPGFLQFSRDLSRFWSFIKMEYGTYAERRAYLWREFEPALTLLESEPSAPSDGSITATLTSAGSSYVHEAWQKALERRTTDPSGAVTAARTLLEAVCKHILDEAGATYDDGADLPKLYSQAARQLNLAPSQHSEQVFKQILGGCQTVVEGLGALRNRLSDAHGKGATAIRPAPRHAELAVNLAGSMATFLLTTWQENLKPTEANA